MSGSLIAPFRRAVALALLGGACLALWFGSPASLDRLSGFLRPVPPAPLTEVLRPELLPSPETQGGVYAPPETRFAPRLFEFAGATRRFYALPAQDVPANGLPPLVLLLHGSGRDGRAMLDMWQAISGQGAFLLAPDALLSSQWRLPEDGPTFLDALLDQARQIQPFDSERIYLYGHSAGANMALYLGQCTDFPARAIAVHAGVVPDCPATGGARPRPYLIQIGDADANYPLAAVRASAERIARSGSPTDLDIIPGHGHWFYDVGPVLAAEAWAFFLRQD